MPMQPTYNEIAAIAATLEELRRDPETPVHIEGDLIIERDDGIEFADLDPGEAARMVVIKTLEHPYWQSRMAEHDRVWEALKWLVSVTEDIPQPPIDVAEAIDAALEASYWDGTWEAIP